MNVPTFARLRQSQRKEVIVELHRRISKNKKEEAEGILKFLGLFTAAATSSNNEQEKKRERDKRLSERIQQEQPERGKSPFGLLLEEFRQMKKFEAENDIEAENEEDRPIEKLVGQLND